MIYKLFEIEESTYLRNRREMPSNARRDGTFKHWQLEHGYFTATVGNGQRFRRVVPRIRGVKQDPQYVPAKMGPLVKIRLIHPAAAETDDVRNLRKRIRRARAAAACPGLQRHREAKARARKELRQKRRAVVRELSALREQIGSPTEPPACD